jgi:hypothetical protein
MATAWNKAMIRMDDEVVFAKLNAMLSVSKDAADKVIQAALRAYKKAAARLNNLQAGSGFAYTTDEEDSSPTCRHCCPVGLSSSNVNNSLSLTCFSCQLDCGGRYCIDFQEFVYKVVEGDCIFRLSKFP